MDSEYFRIKNFKVSPKKAKGRIYLFCGFASPLSLYLPAVNKFKRQGFSVIVFKFKTRPILALSAATIPGVIEEVVSKVEELESNKEKSQLAVAIGNSMGSVFAWHVASRIPSITKVVANTGYALLSKHVFEDKISEPWRNNLLAEGYDELKFHNQIEDYEPISTIPKLKGKEVLLFLNSSDKVISFSNSILFKKALEDNGISYQYVENTKIRHGTAIIKNLLGKKLLDFLKS